MSDKNKTPLTFKAKVGDFENEYEFVIHKFQIPGIGELTSEQALENEQALAALIERKSAVIKEIGSVSTKKKEGK